MRPRFLQEPATRRARSGTLVLALALALASLGLPAQESHARLDDQAHPPLVFLSPSPSGGTASSEAANEFRATAMRDLNASGAFRLEDPAGPAASPSKGLRLPGASFLVRTVSRSVGQGKVLIESECINLQNQVVVLKKSFIGQAQVVQRMAHRLVDILVGTVTGTPGVADSTIVFARQTAPGISEVFGVDRDGKNLRQLTSFGSLTTHPALAGDGKLAVVTYKGGPPQIWGQLQPRGPFLRLHPKAAAPGMEISDLAWAPDGNRLAFVQENKQGLSDIYLLDLRTSRVVRLTEGAHSNRGPSWNPAGTELAFISDRDGAPQVYLMGSDGGRLRRLTNDPTAKDCVAWNPAGDRIAYSTRQDAGSTLFTLAAGGDDRRKVAASAEPVQSLGWAPDGRWLVLGLRRGNDARLRIAGLDGKILDLADGLKGSQFPQWVKDHVSIPTLAQADHPALHQGPASANSAPLS